MKQKFSVLIFLGMAILNSNLAYAAESKPKYGSEATRLYQDPSYVRTNKAPDFWSLIPYYAPQQDGRSCSVASVAMVLNAARASKNLKASDELITQKKLLETVKNETWKKGVGDGGKGVTLDELGVIVVQSLKAYGLEAERVEVVHGSDAIKDQLHAALVENEKSSKDFMIANFLQSVYTGDPEGSVGHIAPIAAYDGKKKRALILDPDRDWYEPYWVSEETLLAGMKTEDRASGKTRGYVWIKLKN